MNYFKVLIYVFQQTKQKYTLTFICNHNIYTWKLKLLNNKSNKLLITRTVSSINYYNSCIPLMSFRVKFTKFEKLEEFLF